jgi:RNA recognition motif-containing protein
MIPEDADMTIETNYTTVMLRNIPNKYTQTSLLDAIDSRGFRGLYNFFYLPVDFKNGCNMGYAFINFVNHDAADMFMSAFKGYQLPAKSTKVCDVCWARVQGFKANVEHYRNSPVNDLPDPEYRPLMFQNGVEVAFPRPDPGVIRRSAARRKHSPTASAVGSTFGGQLSRTSTTSQGSTGVPTAFAESDAAVKLFIGGLSAETRDEDLRAHFAKFGNIADAAVVIDKKTGLSRGFGFCSFKDNAAADKVMNTRQHIINGQSVGVRFYQQGR